MSINLVVIQKIQILNIRKSRAKIRREEKNPTFSDKFLVDFRDKVSDLYHYMYLTEFGTLVNTAGLESQSLKSY